MFQSNPETECAKGQKYKYLDVYSTLVSNLDNLLRKSNLCLLAEAHFSKPRVHIAFTLLC